VVDGLYILCAYNMRQAITTVSYLTPIKRSQRVRAVAFGATADYPWDISMSVELNHALALHALAETLKWEGTWHGGKMPTGGYCWVLSDGDQVEV